MYGKHDRTWLKHADFLIWDQLMCQIAYTLSYWVRTGGLKSPYHNKLYLMAGIVIFLTVICVAFFMEPYSGILRRGYFVEFVSVLKTVFLVALIEAAFLFLTKNGTLFSRLSYIMFVMAAVVLMYLPRIIWKRYLLDIRKKVLYRKTKMVLLTERGIADSVVTTIKQNGSYDTEITGIVYAADIPEEGETVQGIPVVCGADEFIEHFQTEWVDEILVKTGESKDVSENLLMKWVDMGITVHRSMEDITEDKDNQYIAKKCGYRVLTTSIRVVPFRQMLLKRILDIAGGMVGVVLTGIFTLFLGPLIYASSPGPVFFSQVRVGRNGKRFRIYKFRSMYMDAEERKKDLMGQNEMNGPVFKMRSDPRIIGSGPDGSHHGLGWFIRKTSLDEFPQFWNVLKGDMSLVGTRPPTEAEWDLYQQHHRARLAIKPGLTGLWQVSGRNQITDFEEIIKLDMEYVKKWNMGMDIKILLKTVAVLLRGSGE